MELLCSPRRPKEEKNNVSLLETYRVNEFCLRSLRTPMESSQMLKIPRGEFVSSFLKRHPHPETLQIFYEHLSETPIMEYSRMYSRTSKNWSFKA